MQFNYIFCFEREKVLKNKEINESKCREFIICLIMENIKEKKMSISFRTYDTVDDVLKSLAARGVKLSKNQEENVHTFAKECNYAGVSL